MMIQAKYAELYLDLCESFNFIYGDEVEPVIGNKVTWAIGKICAHANLNIKEDSEESLLSGIIYGVFEANQLLGRGAGQTKKEFFEWLDTSQATAVKWSKKLLEFGVSQSDLVIANLDPGTRVLIEPEDDDDFADGDFYEDDEDDEDEDDEENPFAYGYELPRTPEQVAAYISAHEKGVETLSKKVKKHILKAEADPNFDLFSVQAAQPYLVEYMQLVYIYDAFGRPEDALAVGKRIQILSKEIWDSLWTFIVPRAILMDDHLFVEKTLLGEGAIQDPTYRTNLQFDKALYFYKNADSRAEAQLAEAIAGNRHVAQYLFGSKQVPDRPEDVPSIVDPSDEAAAIHYTLSAMPIWHLIPGAIDFLKRVKKSVKKPAQTGKIVKFEKR